jgi:hypothetical protein
MSQPVEKLTVERNIWKAVTEQINGWWNSDDHWEISRLEVGGIIKFGSGDLQMLATIEVLDPPRQFTILWPPQEQYHSIEMRTTYLLAAENGGTRVTVTETGFEGIPDDVRQQRYDSTMKGYETVLADLKAYLEQGA